MRNELNFKDIIEAPLADLISWQRDADVVPPTDQSLYISVLVNYLQSSISNLKTSVDQLLENESPLALIASIRLKIRTKELVLADLNDYNEAIKNESCDMFLGEAYFVAGYGAWTIGCFDEAIAYYDKSKKHLKACGAHKKALKVAQNLLATKTCIDPELKCIPEYHSIYVEAKKLKDFATCGLVLMNISREYQKLGALTLALRTANQAIVFFKKEVGTLHYYLALAHRAHIHLQMKSHLALADIEECLTSDFQEVRQAISVLEKIETQAENLAVAPTVLNPTWRDRLSSYRKETAVDAKFHEAEEKVFAILARGAKDKFELIQELYGDKIDFNSAENRLKNLLFRIRKKSPDLIKLLHGKYQLTDPERRQA